MSLHLAYRPKDFDEFMGNKSTVGKLKAQLNRMNLKLGLLANFYGTQLKLTPVRIG